MKYDIVQGGWPQRTLPLLIALATLLCISANGGSGRSATILSTTQYYEWNGDPQAVAIEVTVADNYLGDPTLYQWIYRVTNNTYNPRQYPFVAKGFADFYLELGPGELLWEIGNVSAPGANWTENLWYSLPICWDVASGQGVMPGQTGEFSFTTAPREQVPTSGGFSSQYLGIPGFEAVYFSTENGLLSPGALLPADPEGSCYANGSCTTMTQSECQQAGGTFCDKPKALIVAGPDMIGHIKYADRLVADAADQLTRNGWETSYLEDPTYATLINQINSDPCITGLFIDSHGTIRGSGNNCALVLSGSTPGKQVAVKPSDLATHTNGRHFEFITPIACFQDAEQWRTAFPGTRISLAPSVMGLTHGDANALAVRWFGLGTGETACGPGNKSCPSSDGNAGQRGMYVNAGVGCSEIAACDSSSCGSDLFPALSCADSIGVSVGAAFLVADADSMIRIRSYWPSAYADSVACMATCYSAVPDPLLRPVERPLGRFLVFDCVARDSLVTASSISVVMKYRAAEVSAAGIVDEGRLGIYLIPKDGQAPEYVPAALDTVANTLAFETEACGVAGIYEIAHATEVAPEPNASSCRIILHQNEPNPFNPLTTLRFELPVGVRVRLEVYDIAGRLIRTLLDVELPAGSHQAVWDGKDERGMGVASGSYFARLSAGGKAETVRMGLIR